MAEYDAISVETFPGSHEVRWFDSLDSTNRYLLDEARRGAPEGLVVVADHQTAGRGRRGREWVAPPGASLLVSVLLRPSPAPEHSQLVSMACGVAMVDAVERVAHFTPALKWPNDLVVGDRKLAGILAEADGAAVIVGVGVNVNWDEFPKEIADTATACNIEAGQTIDRRELLAAFLQELDVRGADLAAAPREYERRLATLGRRVRVEQPHGDIEGRAVGVGRSGELLVDDGTGDLEAVHVGDVIHLRES
jgi:BirA family transcriptional regulator, biotin operon repressor / biotin---[acetyl-CoA-carboxylase] ligase